MLSIHIDRESGLGQPTHRQTRRALIGPVVTVALVALASCSSPNNADGPSTNPPVTTEASTPAPATTPETAPTTASPTTTEALLPALPVGSPLVADTTYRVARSALGRGVQFTNPVDGTRGQSGKGGFALTADELGFDVLIGAFDLAKVRYFIDPLVDAYNFPDDAAFMAATTEPSTDYLSFLATLPGIEAGEVTDTEFAGHPARAMTWTYGAFDGGVPCGPRGTCVNSIWLPGWIGNYFAGDAGTTYVVELDGQTLVFEVQDHPGAQEAADSLVLTD